MVVQDVPAGPTLFQHQCERPARRDRVAAHQLEARGAEGEVGRQSPDAHFLERQRIARLPGREVGRLVAVEELLPAVLRSEEHTSELQSLAYLVCRLLLEKKKIII